VALIVWAVMRNFGQEVDTAYNKLSWEQRITVHFLFGLIAGIVFGVLEILFEKYVFRHVRLGTAIGLASLSYIASVFVIISLGILFFSNVVERNAYFDLLFSDQILLLALYFFAVLSFSSFLREVDRKFGKGNLWKMLRGEFYYPKEEIRIFMFLDLKSSTAIAESIGHIVYSKFIQQCFKDLAVVDNYDAELYQYVGDEAVLTWKIKKGIRNENCIRAFYAFKNKLQSKEEFYLRRFGVTPDFKAGLHVGKIITAEVGEIKREIAYHGDTINTAARIQEECNILGKELLLSEELKNSLSTPKDYEFIYEGEILLKGKTQEIKLYSLIEN
tara:strand:- start:838 stop:1827 length:990 start_codon:yes stop_codon:yes gene_type:complete